jgi:ankyrin repeat protein
VPVNDSDISPLRVAASWGFENVLKVLLSKEANVNERDSSEITPLEAALKNNFPLCAKMLVEEGANVNTVSNNDGLTPLIAVAQLNTVEIGMKLGCKFNGKTVADDDLCDSNGILCHLHLRDPRLLTSI